ncbi:hypothetical protein PG993_001939 [Apiospora rasikravindrae]|uniref:Ubiquitin carboxyl-terminal hydrolase n=1 Tax=Apiospora rasikravindrae TaxID=990691 RepID=A0ABR1UCT2_9PEZI
MEETDPVPETGTSEKKTWVMLENNPDVMTELATKLGLSPELQFYDVYSLDEPELLQNIPRPALALLAIIPLTQTWNADRQAEDNAKPDYSGVGSQESVTWFKQTIGNACGSIGLLHCAINGGAAPFVRPGSDLDVIRKRATPLGMIERADMLYHNAAFEAAHKSVESLGDTSASRTKGHSGQHFVAFVKAEGKLWELEGSRKGPIDRGDLEDDEDVLSPRALDMGLKRIIQLEGDNGMGDVRFSCIALAHRTGEIVE